MKAAVEHKQPGKEIAVVRVQLIKETTLPYRSKPVKSSTDAADILRSYLAGVDREYFIVLLLDNKHRVNALNVVGIGTLTSALVHPREVFKPAVLANAAAVILGHNHPSGDPAPSAEDLELTKRIVNAGDLLGIPVMDHIIVGDRDYVSFLDRGMLASKREGR